jgi:pseudaminic acid synthase
MMAAPRSGSLTINGRRIGPGEPMYVIAEMSANHHQSLDEALAILRAAKDSGADAVKLQTYTPDTLTIDSDAEPFRIGKGTLWEGRRLYELYGEACMPWEWHAPLQKRAAELGIDLFSTAYDATAVDYLEKLNMPAYKVASFEAVDLRLIRKIAQTGKPVILSTGMASLEEIGEAVAAARAAEVRELALLKCTSAYPSPPEEMNLRSIPHLSETFGVPVGLSDHTLGGTVPVAAVALGCCILEKHFTRSRAVAGPDSAFSMEPAEFREMVDAIRVAEKAQGGVRYGVGEREAASRVFRRSLFVVADVRAGERFTEENLRSIRPGYGLAPKHIDEVLGRRAASDIRRGTPLAWEHVEKPSAR